MPTRTNENDKVRSRVAAGRHAGRFADAFLLRFYEPAEAATAGDRAGTQTATRQRTEAADTDRARTRRALPRDWELRRVVTATMTITKVQAEASDQDPKRRVLLAMPRWS